MRKYNHIIRKMRKYRKLGKK